MKYWQNNWAPCWIFPVGEIWNLDVWRLWNLDGMGWRADELDFLITLIMFHHDSYPSFPSILECGCFVKSLTLWGWKVTNTVLVPSGFAVCLGRGWWGAVWLLGVPLDTQRAVGTGPLELSSGLAVGDQCSGVHPKNGGSFFAPVAAYSFLVFACISFFIDYSGNRQPHVFIFLPDQCLELQTHLAAQMPWLTSFSDSW